MLVLALLKLLPLIPQLIPYAQPFLRRASRYFLYCYLVPRYQFVGPWTWAEVMIQMLYIGINSFCLGFGFPSITAAGIRAGNLSLINLIPLFLGPHLNFLADLFDVSLTAFRCFHRSAGLMSFGLFLFHTIVIFASRTSFTSRGTRNIYAIIASPS